MLEPWLSGSEFTTMCFIPYIKYISVYLREQGNRLESKDLTIECHGGTDENVTMSLIL
jgi:hypothetical protein